ncbi:hypothetical protein ACTXT7_004631 [Hymenolepis weldensis]
MTRSLESGTGWAFMRWRIKEPVIYLYITRAPCVKSQAALVVCQMEGCHKSNFSSDRFHDDNLLPNVSVDPNSNLFDCIANTDSPRKWKINPKMRETIDYAEPKSKKLNLLNHSMS